MPFHVSGVVKDLDTGEGVSGVRVIAMDDDLVRDDRLGECLTDTEGKYRIEYDPSASRGLLFPDRPDVYVLVESPAGRTLASTSDDVRGNVAGDVEIDVQIPHADLVAAGLAEVLPPDWMNDLDPEELAMFKTWVWREDADDEVAARLRSELETKSSALELMKSYIDALKGRLDDKAEPMVNLSRLFALGRTPSEMEGHYYGVPVGIRSGDLEAFTERIGNVLGFMWGHTLADVCPWVAKSFTRMRKTRRDALTGSALDDGVVAFAGINHFNKVKVNPLSLISFHVLSWWMGQRAAPISERKTFGHEKNGGDFVAYRAPSVYSGTKREVFSLNYRWPELDNPFPFRWLIDEVVQVADGLYLGQLLFATRGLLGDYDPRRPPVDCRYHHFGHFLLFDERWNPEARRLFPHLDVPVLAPGVLPAEVQTDAAKFKAFTFEDPPPANVNDQIMAEIRAEMLHQPTIMHLLKRYSDTLMACPDNDSPVFLRLQELFQRGIGHRMVQGRFRGALVSWHSAGLTRFFDINTLNVAWMRVGTTFSTWTGKTFEPISKNKLTELTDGYETDESACAWGANTQALRTHAERFVGELMGVAKVWSEKVPADEARQFGYDLKNFFFIGKQAESVHAPNAGKKVFQFNYRWPKLKNIIPDRYCVDELVRIADGLYLGQLMYATNVLKPYDPEVDPKEYRYEHFGYFLLMDDAWHRVRLDIGFDMENV
ncbi:MAG: hypothetical protein ACYTKD_15360 [Planctomycetota bacterium]|jgi:hypothetical protein